MAARCKLAALWCAEKELHVLTRNVGNFLENRIEKKNGSNIFIETLKANTYSKCIHYRQFRRKFAFQNGRQNGLEYPKLLF